MIELPATDPRPRGWCSACGVGILHEGAGTLPPRCPACGHGAGWQPTPPPASQPTDLRRFPSDVPLRRAFQPDSARRHPGKYNLHFLGYVATEERLQGLTLLDPMGGSGGLFWLLQPPWACNVIVNELEPTWAAAARATLAHLQARPTWPPLGWGRVRLGDALTLPYRLGRTPARIGGLVCSPPYGDALAPSRIGAGLAAGFAENAGWGQSSLMRHRQYSVDGMVCSPPYATALTGQRHTEDYTHPKDGPHTAESRRRLRIGYDAPDDGSRPTPGVRNPRQIGNLRGARYAAAMAAVYAACVPLVTPGGPIILVIKNPVEHNQEVDLIGQATAQLTALGCTYVRTHWRYVAPAAFHNIRRKNNPDALIVQQEAALVFRAPLLD